MNIENNDFERNYEVRELYKFHLTIVDFLLIILTPKCGDIFCRIICLKLYETILSPHVIMK